MLCSISQLIYIYMCVCVCVRACVRVCVRTVRIQAGQQSHTSIHLQSYTFANRQYSLKSRIILSADSDGLYQTAQIRSLILAFTVRICPNKITFSNSKPLLYIMCPCFCGVIYQIAYKLFVIV